MEMTVREIADLLCGLVEGDDTAAIGAIASLDEARKGDLSFLHSSKYGSKMKTTRASAVLVAADWEGEHGDATLIRVADPNGAFSAIAPRFAPPVPVRKPGIHPTAVIAPGAKIGADVHIGPWTVVEDGAVIGDRCVIEAQVFIGENVRLGAECHIYPQVTIREACILGARCILHCGVRLGGDGYGYNPTVLPDGRIRIDKIPQLGIVELGDDVEIGSNTTVDRARFGRTRLGNGVKLDNLVQIGHNVRIDDCSGIIAQAGIAGSAHIGSGCIIWAQAGISGHLTVHNGAQVGPQAGVTKDVPTGEYCLGAPAVPKREYAQTLMLPRTVSRLVVKVKELEEKIANLSEGTGR